MTMHVLFSSRLFQNIASNYLAMVWMGGLNLLLIPVYLRLLGDARWGIYLTMQAVFLVS